MADRTLLDRAAVARRLGISVERLYRQRRALEADGFPAPAFGRMSGERWDPAAIDRWLDAKLPPAKTAGFPNCDSGTEDDWADRLDGRVAAVVVAR